VEHKTVRDTKSDGVVAKIALTWKPSTF